MPALHSLNLPPHTVDVNVHPTKREVHFLDEDAITERIADAVQAALVTGRGAHSRAYQQVRCPRCCLDPLL